MMFWSISLHDPNEVPEDKGIQETEVVTVPVVLCQRGSTHFLSVLFYANTYNPFSHKGLCIFRHYQWS